MPFVSIIIPVYNSEKYLARCIDSILSQTYSDYEIILINDGSKDASKEICEFFVQKDNRIKLVNQENKGAAAARNAGIRAATGNYIMFCDSDDAVSENWVKNMVSCLKDEKTFVVCSPCNDISKLGKPRVLKVSSEHPYEIDDYFLFSENGIGGYLWNGIFSSEIIKNNNIFIREHREKGDYNEDLLFTLTYINYVSKIVYNGYSDYLYDTRDNSLSRGNKKYYFEKYAEKYELWEKYLREHNKEDLIPVLSEKMMYHILLSLQFCLEDKNHSRFRNILTNKTVLRMVRFWTGKKENPFEVKLIKKSKIKTLWTYYKLIAFKERMKKK